MGSGWGVSNFIAISSLAIRVYTTYKDTIDDHGYISDEVAALRVLIDKAAQYFKTTAKGSDGRPHAQNVLINCQSVLEDLDSFARKYNNLPPTINLPSTAKQQVILGKKEIVALRESLISNTISLNGFVRSCEYREIQAHLEFILGLHHLPGGSRISITSIASFATNTNTEAAYRQLCEDLYQIGVTEDIIHLKKDEILDAFRSQRMIASSENDAGSEVGGSDIEEKDEVLEMAYKEYCEGLYRIGFTDNMILQQRDEILGILRSRGMVTSTKKTEDKDNKSSSTNVMPSRSFRLTSRVRWSEAGSAPLDILASHCHIGTVELLFAKDSQDNKTTSLHVAAEKGYTELAEQLLDSTLSKGRTGVMGLLFITSSASIDATDKDNNTPLHLAAAQGHIGIVDLLLNRGASVGAIGQYTYTPLHYAALSGHTGIVELLLQKGAPIEPKTQSDNTPLNLAAASGYPRVVKLLLKKGASIEAKNFYYKSPLNSAAFGGHTRSVEILLENGASIDTVDNYYHTPLHYAVLKGNTNLVKLLLEKGASIEAKNHLGKTPLDQAKVEKQTEIIQLLENKAAELGHAHPSLFASIFRSK